MNLTNYEKTPIFRVFEVVKREAARYGVDVLESEIVGLVPSAALTQAAEFYLQLEGFSAASGAGEQAARIAASPDSRSAGPDSPKSALQRRHARARGSRDAAPPSEGASAKQPFVKCLHAVAFVKPVLRESAYSRDGAIPKAFIFL